MSPSQEIDFCTMGMFIIGEHSRFVLKVFLVLSQASSDSSISLRNSSPRKSLETVRSERQLLIQLFYGFHNDQHHFRSVTALQYVFAARSWLFVDE